MKVVLVEMVEVGLGVGEIVLAGKVGRMESVGKMVARMIWLGKLLKGEKVREVRLIG